MSDNLTTLKNIKIPYPTEGIIRTAQLDDTVTPDDSCQIAINMNFDRVGAFQTRLGVANYGGSFPSVSPVNVLSMAALATYGAPSLISSYSESQQDTTSALFAGAVISIGQSFQNVVPVVLQSCKFYLKKLGAPTGNMTAQLYASTGVLGSTSKPTGSALATSQNVDVSTLTTGFQLINFNFIGINGLTLSALTNYVIVVTYNGGDGSNNVIVGLDGSSPSHAGNESTSGDNISWTAFAGSDVCFYIYGAIVGGVKRLFAQIGNGYLVWDQSTWTNLGSEGNPITKARWAQFLNRMWRVNGTNNSPVETSNGGNFDTTLVPADFPSGDFISAGFEGRVWVAQAPNDVIWYTDIVQFTPPNTYALTFDEDVNFIKNFSPQDGESITGLYRVPRALLVFKQNHIYRIYGATSVDAYPAYNVGTYSQESIIQAKDGVYFHHSSGFYQFNYDGQPTEISRRIIDFIQAIPASQYPLIVGLWNGFDAIEWAIGSVTVEGVTYTNCVVRYTISTQVWTIYDYRAPAINSMVVYDDGTNINNLIGTITSTQTAGRLTVIGKLDSGYLDFTNDIYYEYIDRWRTYTDVYAKSQSISGLNIYNENASGANIFFQKQKSGVNVWEELGTVDENASCLFPNAQTDDFNAGRLRISGVTKGVQVVFHGLEVLSVNVKGFDKN